MITDIKKILFYTMCTGCFLSIGARSSMVYASDDKNYTGVYNNVQIIPNSLAYYCEHNAEEFVKNVGYLDECINKIVSNINASDANTASDAKNQLGAIRYEALKILLAESIAKGAAVADYKDVQKDVLETANQSSTEHEGNAANVNTIAVLTDVVNGICDLTTRIAQVEILEDIRSVDSSILKEVMDEEKAKSTNTGTTTETTKYGTTVEEEKQTTQQGDSEDDSEGGNDDGEGGIETGTTTGTSDGETASSEGATVVGVVGEHFYLGNNICGVATECDKSGECSTEVESCNDGVTYFDRSDHNVAYKCTDGECKEYSLE